jgi:hypothetical protein
VTFSIPESLDGFSVAGLQDLVNIAKGEYTALRASVTMDTVTDEQLDRLEALQEFCFSTVPEQLAIRQDKADRFSAATAEPDPEDEGEGDEEVEPEVEEPAAVTASQGAPRVKDLKKAGAPEPEVSPGAPRPLYSALVASASVHTPDGGSYDSGQKLTDMLDVAKIFISRSAGHAGMYKAGMSTTNTGPVYQPVAQLVRDYPAEFSMNGDEGDYDKLLKVIDEKRLPGGSLLASVDLRRKELAADQPYRDSLVAAQGWCAPSETDYDICLQITTDGLADFPEVQARRGGIRHNTGIEFDSIFGGGSCSSPTGFFDLTEAQVAAGTVKTCLEIPCPDFVDTRLGVTGLCLTGNLLAIRGYPEFTATFTRGALAASAHQINREQIADVVAGSTAVTLSGAPWATDGSTVSQVLSAVEMAIVDIKYRLRMQRSATLEVMMPYWIGAQMRADWIRRNATGSGPEAITLADSAINAAFTARGARVQYVYDWQDAFATCAASGSPGADTPIQNLPTALTFLVYPAGTWVRAVNDVITLNSVYDSTKLATNQVTHLFTETGWAMVKMCPVSRVYTVNICPSGKTTTPGTLTGP